jgi:F-type H+-transporting ATPase subunit delta
MSVKQISHRFARALYQAADAENLIDTVEQDVDMLIRIGDASPEIGAFLRSPVIDHWRKKSVIREVLKDRVSPLMLNFMLLVTDKGREAYYREIAREFRGLLDERRNIQRVTVTSAVELSADERGDIERKLSASMGKTVVATFKVDPAVLGGMVVQAGDTVHDSSLRHHLNVLRTRMIEN